MFQAMSVTSAKVLGQERVISVVWPVVRKESKVEW